jgi:hypothetical protein
MQTLDYKTTILYFFVCILHSYSRCFQLLIVSSSIFTYNMGVCYSLCGLLLEQRKELFVNDFLLFQQHRDDNPGRMEWKSPQSSREIQYTDR